MTCSNSGTKPGFGHCILLMIKGNPTTTKGLGRYTKFTGDLHETTRFTDR
jgi:hypothetical protein